MTKATIENVPCPHWLAEQVWDQLRPLAVGRFAKTRKPFQWAGYAWGLHRLDTRALQEHADSFLSEATR